MLFTLKPKVGIGVGLFANLVEYLGWNIVLCAGCLGIDFNLSAYCSDRRSRLLYRDSSFASTYRLSMGEVLNAPKQSRNP